MYSSSLYSVRYIVYCITQLLYKSNITAISNASKTFFWKYLIGCSYSVLILDREEVKQTGWHAQNRCLLSNSVVEPTLQILTVTELVNPIIILVGRYLHTIYDIRRTQDYFLLFL